MNESVLNSKAAVELLELMKYFDKSLKDCIPTEVVEKLNRAKSDSYTFKVDTSKTLEEQEILPETKKMLVHLYIQFCCSPEEKAEIYSLKNKKREQINDSFNTLKIMQHEVTSSAVQESKQLVDNTKLPWYKKIVLKFKQLFNR